MMAERMDTRKVPKLEAFDEESGMSLRDYLEEFEEYCMDNIKGDSRYWIRELEGQLSGELLEAFKHFRQCKDTYHKLKRKILEWYENMEEFRKKDHKRKFEKAQMKKEETLFLYSMRLQRLFELAYPRRNPEKSDSLREKFLKTVPDSFKKILKTILFYDSHNHTETRWSAIQRCAQMRDRELKTKEISKDESDDSEKEIIINIQESGMKKSVSAPSNFNQSNQASKPEQQQYQPPNNQQFQNWNNNQRMNNFRSSAPSNMNQFRNRAPNSNYSNNRMNYPRHQNSGYQNQRPQNQNRNVPTCQYCNKVGHTFDVCRTRLNRCHICNQLGHMPWHCNKKNQQSSYQNGDPSCNISADHNENRDLN